MITNNEKRVVYDGISFCRENRSGYYHNTKLRKYLHQYIWIQVNGEIPKGYHIHHIDHNKNNNNIENLELISPSEHSKLHWENNEELREFSKKNIREKAMPALKKWKQTKEAKEFYSLMGKRNTSHLLDAMKRKSKKICEYCGKEYEVNDCTKSHSRFCSNKCKSYWRKKQGIDNEIRKCVVCGKEFEVNKYARKECCSKTCAGKKSSASRKGKPQKRRCI